MEGVMHQTLNLSYRHNEHGDLEFTIRIPSPLDCVDEFVASMRRLAEELSGRTSFVENSEVAEQLVDVWLSQAAGRVRAVEGWFDGRRKFCLKAMVAAALVITNLQREQALAEGNHDLASFMEGFEDVLMEKKLDI